MLSIRYQFSSRKALEAILFLAGTAPGGRDFHGILKLLFFADVLHLNRHGRPIVGDVYKALPYGPVAQGTYDILKSDPLAVEELDQDLPFDKVGRYIVQAHRAHDPRLLSRSDLAALSDAVDRYGHLDFKSQSDLSHQHPAYRRGLARSSLAMRYEDFLDPDRASEEHIADLAETAPLLQL